MKWIDRMPLPVRYAVGTAIVLSYVVREAIEIARLPRAERERLFDMVLDAVKLEVDSTNGSKR